MTATITTTIVSESKHGAKLDSEQALRKPTSSSDLYTRLIQEGRFIVGYDEELVPLKDLSWIDKTLVSESIDFHYRYFALIIFANTAALMFGYAIKPNSAVLLRTGLLHDPERAYKRYLSTIHRIWHFFAFPFDLETAYKAFSTVRKMHVLASKKPVSCHPSSDQLKLKEPWKTELALAIRQDLAFIDTSSAPDHALTWSPPVPVSQFDMAVTQFGFWGAIWCSPKVFGVANRDKELRGVIHVWAIFGRLLGIRDEFNICLQQDAKVYDKLYRNIVIHSLKTIDETVITLQATLMTALSRRLPFITYKSLVFLGLSNNFDRSQFKGNNIWKLMSLWDKVCFKFLQVLLWLLRNVSGFRLLTNIVVLGWLQIQFRIHLPTASRLPVFKYIFAKMD